MFSRERFSTHFFFSGQNSHTGPHFCLRRRRRFGRLVYPFAAVPRESRHRHTEPCKIPCSFCAYVSESCCCSPSPFVHGGGASVPPVPEMMANLSSPSRALFFTTVVRTVTLHLDESDSPSFGDSSSLTATKSSTELLWGLF